MTGAVVDRLDLLGVLLGGLLLARVEGRRRPQPCRGCGRSWPIRARRRTSVAILRLAAANRPWPWPRRAMRGVDDRSPPLLVVRSWLRARAASSFSTRAWSCLLVFGVGRGVAGTRGRLRPSPRPRPARRPGGGSRAGRRARAEDLGLGRRRAIALGLLDPERRSFATLADVVLTIAHSGRNSRGGPGRAPRPSFASH